MNNSLASLFQDPLIARRIQQKFPLLFHIAEEESRRDGKIGMEVGTLRERIVVSLLTYYFGEERVNTQVPTTESEKDVVLDDSPISIKTITSSSSDSFRGVKVSWTVDTAKAKEFSESYNPTCDILFVHICWGHLGAFYYIPKKVQQDTLASIGRECYIKLPKVGTNPRGIEFSNQALKALCEHPETHKLAIDWIKPDMKVNIYKRWIELWEQD